MPFSVQLKSITFSGGETIQLAETRVVVLVGPNNAGKSRALRGIRDALTGDDSGPVISSLQDYRSGTVDDMADWLSAHTGPHRGDPQFLAGLGEALLREDQAEYFWSDTKSLGSLGKLVVSFADADTRLGLANNVQSINPRNGTATHPLQRLLIDPDAERRLSRASQRAFRTGVCLPRNGGSELELLVGAAKRPAIADDTGYLAELKALESVREQGDGMRSFIGLMLLILCGRWPLILVDEPEAFLHPPQARELGRQLAASPDYERQIVIATHSLPVLLGLVDRADSLAIIRLSREGNVNRAAVLDKTRVGEVWADPVFRYSNLMDGLFHTGVLICEAEGDALLYGATLDAMHEPPAQDTEPSEQSVDAAPDLLFTHCGGKHRMPRAVDALSALDVPVSVIADIDVLREKKLLKEIVDSLDGEWSDIERDWNIVADHVKNQGKEKPWDDIKKAGKSAIPKGQATTAAKNLFSELAVIGLHVVPVGELEGWDRELAKPNFATSALERDIHRTNRELQDFVAAIADRVEKDAVAPTPVSSDIDSQ